MSPFTWGLNESRTEHKASLSAAWLRLPEGKGAAEPDPSPCPRDTRSGLSLPSEAVWFPQGSSAGSCSSLRMLQQPTANPRGRGLQCIKQKNGYCIMPTLLYSWLEFNTQETSFSASSLQPWKQRLQQSHAAETAVLSGLQEPGDVAEGREVTSWERRICGSGHERWERGKGIPLLMGLLRSRRAQ